MQLLHMALHVRHSTRLPPNMCSNQESFPNVSLCKSAVIIIHTHVLAPTCCHTHGGNHAKGQFEAPATEWSRSWLTRVLQWRAVTQPQVSAALGVQVVGQFPLPSSLCAGLAPLLDSAALFCVS